jgi:hypothetical protein
MAESFFATLTVELVHDAAWATRAGDRGELVEYLEVFYNGQRRHSASATSVPGRSSGSANTQHRQLKLTLGRFGLE